MYDATICTSTWWSKLNDCLSCATRSWVECPTARVHRTRLFTTQMVMLRFDSPYSAPQNNSEKPAGVSPPKTQMQRPTASRPRSRKPSLADRESEELMEADLDFIRELTRYRGAKVQHDE